MGKMRIALLGNGTMGAFHAAGLRELPEVGEVRVFDLDPRRRTHDTVSSALAGADGAVIATPAATHADLLRCCAREGVPAFCEKPLALDEPSTAALVDELEASGLPVQIGFQRRFDPAFAEARRRVLAGELGEVRTFQLTTLDRTPLPREYLATSGGIFRDMHVHDFDLVRWLLGGEIESVYAAGSVLVDPAIGSLGDVDTSGIVLRLPGGTLGLVAGCRANPAGYTARLDLHGSADSWSVREDRPYRDFLDRYAEAYRAELRQFLRVARGESESPVTARDALQALRVAEACERSRRKGAEVSVGG
jgi:myo-inositol 2-dehydrogenase / D-chiro-inositol 1-dehydrogenase